MFGTRLVVVLGHTQCGAIAATLQELAQPVQQRSPHLRSIVDRIKPSVHALAELHPLHPGEDLMALATRANIRASVGHLRHGSQLLEELARDSGLRVVGAEYSLETGVVRFLAD